VRVVGWENLGECVDSSRAGIGSGHRERSGKGDV
jgi:hypothetical protein